MGGKKEEGGKSEEENVREYERRRIKKRVHAGEGESLKVNINRCRSSISLQTRNYM